MCTRRDIQMIAASRPQAKGRVERAHDWLVSYEGRLLQLERQSRHHAPAKSRMLVSQNDAGTLHIEYRGRTIGFAKSPSAPHGNPRAVSPPTVLGSKATRDGTPLGDLLNPSTNGKSLLWYDTD